jgi:DNA adenine methylase
MTVYHGGKQRISKAIGNFIIPELSLRHGYCEPFCGMLSVFHALPDQSLRGKSILVSDSNQLIADMWLAAQSGWVPPRIITKEEYDMIRHSDNAPLKTFVGHQYSYGGVYFSSFTQSAGQAAADRVTLIGNKLRDLDAKVTQQCYSDYSDLENYVIYCDPPYQNTVCNYKHGSFNSNLFWDWCRQMARKNTVFVSEYSAPDDFQLVYTCQRKFVLRGRYTANSEKLYLVPSS